MVQRRVLLTVLLTLIVFLPFILIKRKNEENFLRFRPRHNIVEGVISGGDMLGDVLAANSINPEQATLIIAALKKVFDVRKCNIGDRWEFCFDKEGTFRKFTYYDVPIDYYVVEPKDEGDAYLASALKIETEKKMRGVRGEIMSSLYESMSFVEVNPEIIIQFAEIFASKVDFFTDCRTGDTFNILWESHFDKKGTVLKDERISAASYSAGGETYYAFYFETPEGKAGYYDEKGKSVEAVFLKAPLNYRRISSYFTYRRLHPIRRIYRPHLGIDYAAQSGTPVSSIGDGSVTLAGRKGGLGITVIVKHPNGYTSWYGHLSRIAKGVRKGARVKKGQVIGYVGSTGVSTGPHLDFRIQKGGKFLNFLALKMPPSYPLDKKYMSQFNEKKDILMGRIEGLKSKEQTIFPNN